MGLEANCSATWGDQTSEGKAQLEGDAVLFRGGFRVKLLTRDLKKVEDVGGALVLRHPEGTLRLQLGAASRKWADKILNPPSRLDKLGVKPEQKIAVLGVEDRELIPEIEKRAARVLTRLAAGLDLIFFGASKPADLARLEALRGNLKPEGGIWVIYPKGVKTITQADVMAASKSAGLVDVKVCGFSATHTALKCVIPLAKR